MRTTTQREVEVRWKSYFFSLAALCWLVRSLNLQDLAVNLLPEFQMGRFVAFLGNLRLAGCQLHRKLMEEKGMAVEP